MPIFCRCSLSRSSVSAVDAARAHTHPFTQAVSNAGGDLTLDELQTLKHTHTQAQLLQQQQEASAAPSGGDGDGDGAGAAPTAAAAVAVQGAADAAAAAAATAAAAAAGLPSDVSSIMRDVAAGSHHALRYRSRWVHTPLLTLPRACVAASADAELKR
jgi:hypothetical protein